MFLVKKLCSSHESSFDHTDFENDFINDTMRNEFLKCPLSLIYAEPRFDVAIVLRTFDKEANGLIVYFIVSSEPFSCIDSSDCF